MGHTGPGHRPSYEIRGRFGGRRPTQEGPEFLRWRRAASETGVNSYILLGLQLQSNFKKCNSNASEYNRNLGERFCRPERACCLSGRVVVSLRGPFIGLKMSSVGMRGSRVSLGGTLSF